MKNFREIQSYSHKKYTEEKTVQRQKVCAECLQLFSQELWEGEEQEESRHGSTCELSYFISSTYLASSFYLNNKPTPWRQDKRNRNPAGWIDGSWLRVLVALPRTIVRKFIKACNPSSRGPNTFFSPSWGTHTHMWHILTQAYDIYTKEKKKYF